MKWVHIVIIASFAIVMGSPASSSSCPNPKGAILSDGDLQKILALHFKWYKQGGHLLGPGRRSTITLTPVEQSYVTLISLVAILQTPTFGAWISPVQF